jgi:hypothetical protein
MDAAYIDIDGCWLWDPDSDGPERAPIADEEYARLELRGRAGRQSKSGLEPASVVLELVCRKGSRVTDVAIERDALGVNRSGDLDRARGYQLAEIPGRFQV